MMTGDGNRENAHIIRIFPENALFELCVAVEGAPSYMDKTEARGCSRKPTEARGR